MRPPPHLQYRHTYIPPHAHTTLDLPLQGERKGAWLEGAEPSLVRFHKQKVESIVHTNCQAVGGVQTTGRLYELCVPCAVGSDCSTTTYEENPPADSTFFRFDHDIDSGDGQNRCPKERWDTTLAEEFPDLQASRHLRRTVAAPL